ncbi:MAG TPA: hypothetical protein VFK90_06800 [Anaeromyxobacter sp.]|nr:hypothetical protein [Anaeromyxobacter sp.]
MSAGRTAAGEAIVASAPDLARLWRATRLQGRRRLLPGLLDGIVADVLVRAGEGLAAGDDPALAWSRIAGVVRLEARERARSRVELEADWDALESVFRGACEALAAGDEVKAWIAQALAAARAGARTLGEAGGPPGIVVVWWFADPPPARRGGPGAGPR